MRLTRRRNAVAQDRENKAGDGEREAKRVQEDPGTIHELREEQKTREDELGNAPVPLGAARGGEGRRARGVEDILPDPAAAVQLVGEEQHRWSRGGRRWEWELLFFKGSDGSEV